MVYGLPNDDNLYAVPFDLDSMEVKGGPVPVAEGVMGHGVQSALSHAGTLVYIPGISGSTSPTGLTLVWVDRQGKEEPIAVEQNLYVFPKISRSRAGGRSCLRFSRANISGSMLRRPPGPMKLATG